MKIPKNAVVTVPLHKMIVVDGDHGGYQTGFCAVCERHGWLDVPDDAPNGIKHTPECPVGQALAELKTKRKDKACSLP
jgi:hypothetical protein